MKTKRKRSKRKQVPAMPMVEPTAEQLTNGSFEREFVTHAETATKAMTHQRRKTRSSLQYMHGQGSLTDEQFYSAQEIARVAEMIERNVSIGCASLEARVDCSGSAKDALYESLWAVRLEAAYSRWRAGLRLPRRLVLDMVTKDGGFAAIASGHGMGYLKAVKVLKLELDRWPAIRKQHHKAISAEDLESMHEGLTGA